MAASEETRTITGWQRDSRLYRRPPGPWWLLALLAIPLLLGLLGWGMLDKSKTDVTVSPPSASPSANITAPSVSAPNVNAPALDFAPLSIVRKGNDFTLSGDIPDGAARQSLIETLKTAFGADINVIDNLNVKAGAKTPDFTLLGPVLKAAVDIPDFGWKIDGDTLTLTGTAPSEDVKAAVEAAARAAIPDLKIDNQIKVVAASTPATPAAPAPGQCTTLQADINELLRTPINFDTDGFTLTPASQQLLSQIAAKVKNCPEAKLSVKGYTDNTGNDAINIPLSGNRAKSVADYLTSQGIPAANVASQGVGSADPVASNATPAGRAQNRRVEISVS